MVDRFYGYQYDTNPRKLNQNQAPYRNRYSQNKDVNYKNDNSKTTTGVVSTKKVKNNSNVNYESSIKNTNDYKVNSKKQVNIRNSNNIKVRFKLVMYLITSFYILFAISYQNSLINESFNKKEQYKKEMEALSKTNQQMEVSIENNLNLNNIEQAAKDKLGMKKLDNSQKIYVSLPKQDYVAPAAEQVVIEEEMGFFEKLVKGFSRKIN